MDWSKIEHPPLRFTDKTIECAAAAVAIALKDFTENVKPLGVHVVEFDPAAGIITFDMPEPTPPQISLKPNVNPEVARELIRLAVLDGLIEGDKEGDG